MLELDVLSYQIKELQKWLFVSKGENNKKRKQLYI